MFQFLRVFSFSLFSSTFYVCFYIGLYGNDDFHNGMLQTVHSARQIESLVHNFTNKVNNADWIGCFFSLSLSLCLYVSFALAILRPSDSCAKSIHALQFRSINIVIRCILLLKYYHATHKITSSGVDISMYPDINLSELHKIGKFNFN